MAHALGRVVEVIWRGGSVCGDGGDVGEEVVEKPHLQVRRFHEPHDLRCPADVNACLVETKVGTSAGGEVDGLTNFTWNLNDIL